MTISTCAQSPRRQRRSDKDVFHSFMVKNAHFAGEFDMPCLDPVRTKAADLISFPEAMSAKCHEYGNFVHFFVDDFRFERLWNNPERYKDKLKMFAGVIEPDFSTCPNFPGAIKLYNAYRNRACARWMQDNGITVVPNVRIDYQSSEYLLPGIPHHSTIAIGAHGCIKNKANRRRFIDTLKLVVDKLKPSNILVYGSDAYGAFDYPRHLGIELSFYADHAFERYGGDSHER